MLNRDGTNPGNSNVARRQPTSAYGPPDVSGSSFDHVTKIVSPRAFRVGAVLSF
jgi:hypothetical protein